MKFAHFFVDHPVFAAVVSIVITLLGAVALPTLPVAQYPQIAPPSVTINATYPGASAETLATTVAQPIEEQINGVEDMLFMSSQSTADGHVSITVTFRLGADIDKDLVLVENRAAVAVPQLPAAVQATGLVVRKASPDILLAVHFYSPDNSLDQQYISNYFTLHVRDELLRLPGVGDLGGRAARDYAMRIWIDPDKAAQRNITVEDVVGALRAHNVQVAAGSTGQPPFGPGSSAQQLNIQTEGLLTTPAQFGDIVVKSDAQGRYTRVSDVARVELGAADYTTDAHLVVRQKDGTIVDRNAAAVGVLALPGANGLETAAAVRATMKRLGADFPPGLAWDIIYNPTQYVEASITEVEKTLGIAIVLVVIVIVVFLQTWRAALIPILAIPVALVGSMTILKAAGFSLNTLTLFALVLAIGIVVDDAIVVVENIERKLSEGLSVRDAAHATVDEVGGALVAIALVLIAVFAPAALIGGITGQFYRQFAVTIAAATVLSLTVSLTLSPALCVLVLRRHAEGHERRRGLLAPLAAGGQAFTDAFSRLSDVYSRLTTRLVRLPLAMLGVFAVLLVLTALVLVATPTGFIPNQDQGNLIAAIQLPAGASLDRTDQVTRQVTQIALATPGVLAGSVYAGVDATSGATQSNAGQIYLVLDPFDERIGRGLTSTRIAAELRRRMNQVTGADVKIIDPPPVRGIGNAGGLKMIVQDRTQHTYRELEQAAQALADEANRSGAVANAFVSFNTRTPRIYADIDRTKAEVLGVPDTNVFDTLQTYLGSTFINTFNYLNHTYQVYAQADWPFRQDPASIGQLKTRSASGAMVPLGAFVTLQRTTGPYRVLRYNLYPGAEVQADAAPGKSSGEAIRAMEAAAAKALPNGFGYEWTDLALQQKTAQSGGLTFVMAVVFAFLVLAALYESVTLPFSVILIVPMCLLAAMTGVALMGRDNNILTQVGLIVLIGLAAKNAILIVEFARQAEQQDGLKRQEAAASAAHTRLRPILMTSFAFIFGVAPLAFASGAGAEMRQALGIAVFFGMIGVTVFGLVFTPTFYVVFRAVADRLPKPPRIQPAAERATPEPAE
jgi:HAE1 family hydrophobic/amphiphilic exporter-1